MITKIKVDKVCLSCNNLIHKKFDYNSIPGWEKVCHIKDKNEKHAYKTRIRYKNQNGSTMRICIHPRRGWLSPLYIIITPPFEHEIPYNDVKAVLSYFEETFGYRFKLSCVDIAIDLISSKYINLYSKVIKSFKAGKRRGKPYRCKNGIYFGKKKYPVVILVYNKTKQLLEEKNTKIVGDVVRIETRFYLPRCKNFIQTLDELADYDFSFIYGKYFSLHNKTVTLNKLLNSLDIPLNQPIWKITAVRLKATEIKG